MGLFSVLARIQRKVKVRVTLLPAANLAGEADENEEYDFGVTVGT